jgi:hypothetical protein
VRFYRFFFLAPLYVALPFFLLKLRDPRFLWVAITLAIFALGVNFYPFFETHYLGALTCLFVLVSVIGLREVPSIAATLILSLCLAHFAFFYARSFFQAEIPTPRILVIRQLARAPGKQLVFVRYWPRHIFQNEWVYNDADLNQSRVVWARDLGDSEDQKLQHYYPGRTAWLLEPDATPPKLAHFQAEPVPQKTAPLPPTPNPQTPKRPPLRFEPVR